MSSTQTLDEIPIPVRMVNEYVYCPRLAYLEWVQGEWAASADTVEGSHLHRRVDQPGKGLPTPDENSDEIHARSVELESDTLGIRAKLDLVEGQSQHVQPVDYKRGKRPHVAKGAFDPERVQLCLQGLLLREHGYTCQSGILYFAGSRERVTIDFDDELIKTSLNAVTQLRQLGAHGIIPEPLEDSPKCARCSLVSICLPDEIGFLNHAQAAPRPIAVANPVTRPLAVSGFSGKVSKQGEELQIETDETTHRVRVREISQLAIFGNVYVTTPCLRALMERQIPISWHSYGGWFSGHSIGTGHKNVELRTAQYKRSFDERYCLQIARTLINGKILNARTLIRRNWRDDRDSTDLLAAMRDDARKASRARSLEQLLGIEGAAAARYFRHFSAMIKANGTTTEFDFHRRNRRPPRDPINAMLSLAYAVLTRHWSVALSATGLDPYRGFYHQPRYGRPALALDMMEPFRPLIADSAVITAINNRVVNADSFLHHHSGVALKAHARKAFLALLEKRLEQEITHPEFGYRISYRRLLEVEARLLGRYLTDEIEQPHAFTTR